MIEIHRENWLKVPEMSAMGVVDRLYPYQLFLPAEGQAAVQGILRTFNLVDAAKQVRKTPHLWDPELILKRLRHHKLKDF